MAEILKHVHQGKEGSSLTDLSSDCEPFKIDLSYLSPAFMPAGHGAMHNSHGLNECLCPSTGGPHSRVREFL
jgi:hypothetical protein